MAHNGAKQQQGSRYRGLDAAERTSRRRAAVLAAALELFASQGYAATSVKQICRQAGLTERYFYQSFRDRQACLVALYGELAAQMHAVTTAALDESGGLGVDELARQALSAFIDYLACDTRRARVVLLEAVGVCAELEERRHAVLRDFAELIATVWLDRTEQVRLTTAQRLAAVGLVGAVNHLLVDWLHRGQRETQEEIVGVCSTLFLAAWRQLRAEQQPEENWG